MKVLFSYIPYVNTMCLQYKYGHSDVSLAGRESAGLQLHLSVYESVSNPVTDIH